MTVKTSANQGAFPNTVAAPASDLIPAALPLVLSTVAGRVEGDVPSVRVPFISEDAEAAFTPEGADIALDDPTLGEVVVTTAKIAVLTKVTREARAYENGRTLIVDSLLRAVTRRGNAAFLAGSGSPGGLLNTAGITDAGTLGDNLDGLSDAMTAVEVAGGIPSHIVMDPASWGVVRSLKSSAGSAIPLIGAPADQAERRLFGLPVVVSADMPAGSALVLDRSNVVSASGDVEAASSDQLYFNSDSIAYRCIWRLGWRVVRPTQLAKVAVTLPDDD